ncbi:NAD(P)H-dependent oxidoreductase [Planococcus shenhongbingii]|uniref:NAD(P)H-dependent oxidoreductase n=1 Tax=Planococcus shenhongbingii TaxID=3058398 RepID=A0ABT8NI78_9BACL|nr:MULTISPECIES: NAD(P)H-dependent oxidoreductase [unclassified Planococcus (in: firmicutes)]MDN7247160.1 NAD(P)H-dependent oxidoreductase [Planococcus sp. N017]WKA57026.1 NAD(P)H-dependent oxidoreductase [Planococcus sp. N016]
MTKKILCIIANPDTRADSLSSSISRAFLDELRASQRESEINEMNLYEIDMPALNFNTIKTLEPMQVEEEDFNRLLEQLTDSDAFVFISQTIAFGLPARLKSFIEILLATKHIEKLGNKKAFHLQIEDDTLGPIYQTNEHEDFRNFLKEKSVNMIEPLNLPHHHLEAGEHENVLLEIIEDTRLAAREFAQFINQESS